MGTGIQECCFFHPCFRQGSKSALQKAFVFPSTLPAAVPASPGLACRSQDAAIPVHTPRFAPLGAGIPGHAKESHHIHPTFLVPLPLSGPVCLPPAQLNRPARYPGSSEGYWIAADGRVCAHRAAKCCWVTPEVSPVSAVRAALPCRSAGMLGCPWGMQPPSLLAVVCLKKRATGRRHHVEKEGAQLP